MTMTLEDLIAELGIDRTRDEYPCTDCGRPTRTFGLLVDEEDESATCANCLVDRARAEQLAIEDARPAPSNPWDGEQGVFVKAERNRRVNEAMWAVDPATSPLSAECRDAWGDYVRALHRITIEFAEPAAVEWPVEPATEFEVDNG